MTFPSKKAPEKSKTVFKGIKLHNDIFNDRLKVLDYEYFDEQLVREVIAYARKNSFGKIIANIREEHIKLFNKRGFINEGSIEGFFRGETAYLLSFFLDVKRGRSPMSDKEDEILSECLKNARRFVPLEERDYLLRGAKKQDICQMIDLFSAVFDTYPSPVFDPEYLGEIMDRNVLFWVAEKNKRIIAIASAEMDFDNLNAEITDCVTLQEERGKNILSELIAKLESELVKRDIVNAYSLSRATNIGINKALAKGGYRYKGRLVNNCHICGKYEDMNIWDKKLIDPARTEKNNI